ncbi:hypothetical protein CI610_02930 [invertebrate metagenome]|uniref:Reverse transcriptase domain-containing protein n=1 Tax=invertebrate metagenome TaxID=1711999 RepID=A0A2H9T4K1_9ZZZZ
MSAVLPLVALQSLIINSIEQNKRLYCVFIDYSKAFDSVNHQKLWYKLWRNGIRGRLLNVIKSIYDNVRSCVKLNGKLSAMFDLHVGLLQGESLSPMLYSLFVNDMESHFINSNCQSYSLQLINLFMLMYADDTVLFSEDVTDLQNMLDSLQTYTLKWNLKINTDKTKIVVFRKRKRMLPSENWTFNGNPIEIVDKFCYLGLIFNFNGRFTAALDTLACQGRKAYYHLKRKMKVFTLNIETKMSLFDTYVACVLNYGCEVWGQAVSPQIEKIHLLFLKDLLNVKKTVNSAMVSSKLVDIHCMSNVK